LVRISSAARAGSGANAQYRRTGKPTYDRPAWINSSAGDTIISPPTFPEGGTPIEASSPARLYATLVGATLTILGIIGFFYSAGFGSPGEVDKVFGILAVNGWHNALYLATGLLGLTAAGYASRPYALAIGLLYTVIAIWGFILGSDGNILGFIPVNTEDSVLHLILGLTGLAAGAATQARARTTPAPA
jgi:hypothetical protein